MKNLKEKSGITLIALVITIIVLLILAGVAIATLTGDNGILTQSQKAKYASIYKEAEEQVQLATMAVKAEIAGRKAKLGTYNATDPDSINALKAIVATDLVSEGSGFEVADPVDGATTGTKLIKIRYSNTALKAGGIDDGNPPVPAQTGHVNYVITVTARDAELTTNITDEEYESGNIGNGGQAEEPQEPETPVVTTVTVSFYENKGDSTAITTKQVDSGSSIGSSNMPANPTNSNNPGYAFTGWKKSTDDSDFTASTTVSADTSVYASWVDPISTFGDANTTYKSYFGKLVTGYDAKSGYDWRLFYADNNFAYLLAERIGNYRLDLIFSDFNSATISTLGKNLNPGCSEAFWTNNAGKYNMKGISGLLNTAKWTAYATNSSNESIANWAIGGPTLEMFIKSYNATHTSPKLYSNVENDTAMGYRLSPDGSSWYNNASGLGSSSELDRAIYSGNGDYWLASTCYDDEFNVMWVGGDGTVKGKGSRTYYAIRPLVSVPLSEIGLESENKTIKITNNYFNT